VDVPSTQGSDEPHDGQRNEQMYEGLSESHVAIAGGSESIRKEKTPKRDGSERHTGTSGGKACQSQGYTGNEFSDLGFFFFFPAPSGQPTSTDYVIRHITIQGNST
jgi:hypothetical protein